MERFSYKRNGARNVRLRHVHADSSGLRMPGPAIRPIGIATSRTSIWRRLIVRPQVGFNQRRPTISDQVSTCGNRQWLFASSAQKWLCGLLWARHDSAHRHFDWLRFAAGHGIRNALNKRTAADLKGVAAVLHALTSLRLMRRAWFGAHGDGPQSRPFRNRTASMSRSKVLAR